MRVVPSRTVAVCIGVLLLGSCGSSSPPEAVATSSASASGRPTVARAHPLPLDAFEWDDATSSTISNAQQLLVASCMKDQGFTYVPQLDQGSPAPGTGDPITPELGIADAASAREHGYRSAESEGAAPQLASGPDPNSEAYNRALLGALAGSGSLTDGFEQELRVNPGCLESASLAVWPREARNHAQLANELGARAAASARADRRVVAALGDWSRCMKGRGFRFASPQEASGSAWPKELGAREIATAVADVACKNSTGLIDRWLGVQAEYERDLIHRNRATLDQITDDYRAALERATALLGERR